MSGTAEAVIHSHDFGGERLLNGITQFDLNFWLFLKNSVSPRAEDKIR